MNVLYYRRFLKKIDWNKIIIIAIISLIVSIVSMIFVIAGYAKTLDGTIYMWTGHYYLDYFFYLVAIAQGQRGAFFAYQQFSTNDFSRFYHLEPYIIIGQITRLFHLTPIASYWIALFILFFIFTVLMFFTISKLLPKTSFYIRIVALLFALLASPFYTIQNSGANIGIHIFDYWYASGTIFDRFEPIPHHMLSSVFILLALLIHAKLLINIETLLIKNIIKYLIAVIFLIVSVISFNSFAFITPFITISLSSLIYLSKYLIQSKKKAAQHLLFYLFIFLLTVIPSAFFIKYLFSKATFLADFKNVEAAYHQNPGILLVILNIGPILLLALFGIRKFLCRLSPIVIVLCTFTLVSFGLYFSSLDKIVGTHNGRFLSPIYYVLFGTMAILGIKQVAAFFGRYYRVILIFISFLYIFYSLPPHIMKYNAITNDKNIFSPISYLPKGIIEGFKRVDSLPPQGAILITPSQFLGTVLPIYSKRATYVARHFVTPNYLDKNIKANNFYIGNMSVDQGREFLRENNIVLVALTSIEGYTTTPLKKYPFLKEIYNNSDIMIFKVDNNSQ